MADHINELDLNATYKINGEPAVAWYILGYVMVRDEDWEWSGVEYQDPERVRMVMVGDDRVFEFDVSDLIKLDEGEWCPGCGQIGCGHG